MPWIIVFAGVFDQRGVDHTVSKRAAHSINALGMTHFALRSVSAPAMQGMIAEAFARGRKQHFKLRNRMSKRTVFASPVSLDHPMRENPPATALLNEQSEPSPAKHDADIFALSNG